MNLKIFRITILLILSVLVIAGCDSITPPGSGNGEPTPIPTVISDIEIVSEGRIAPNDSVQLSFFSTGQVEEILVEEDDIVKAGDIVARLGNREQIEAGIAAADAEVLAAQQALDKLYENNEINKANALQAIADAEKQVRDDQYQIDNFTIPSVQAGKTAEEAVAFMKTRLDEAREAFEPYKYYSSGNDTREELKEDLDEAQADFDSAVKRLRYETALKNSQAKLDKAKQDYEKITEGPDEDDVATAESRIKATEANLEAAKASLDDLDLEATIDGTVVKQDLYIGQQVSPGVPVMTIADFSEMYAETDDLTEIEVVDISVGQKVTVVADALSDIEMTGVVEKINEIYEEKRGDVTYTVRIVLDEIDPRLRWGMTVVVTFEK